MRPFVSETSVRYLAFAWVFLALAACPGAGAPITWTSGSATSDNWSDGGNWSGSIPGSSDTAVFDQTASGSTEPVTGNSIVDISFAPIQKLTYGAVGAVSTSHATIINSGVTLRVDGDGTAGSNGTLDFSDFSVGNDTSVFNTSKTTSVTISGLGAFQVGQAGTNTADIVIGRRTQTGAANNLGGVTATLNMTGLANFAANVDELVVGFSGVDGPANSTLTLGTTNTIRANSVNIADSANNGGNSSSIRLGQTNTLYADTIYVGHRKSSGSILFDTGLTNPILTLANLAGTGGADLYIGYNDADTGTTPVSTLDTTAGTINATLDQAVIGLHRAGAGNSSGELKMARGTVTANSILLADPSAGGTSTAPGNTRGTITMMEDGSGNTGTFHVTGNITDGGGTSTLNIYGGAMAVDGSVNVDYIRVGQATHLFTTTPVSSVVGTLTLNGPSVTVASAAARGDIYVGRRTIETNWHSIGTLDMRNAGSFTAYLTTLGIGIGPAGATAQGQAGGTVYLAADNLIDSTTITLADSVSVGLAAQTSRLHLGRNNTFFTSTLTVGGNKGVAVLDYLYPNPSTWSTLDLGSSAQRATVYVARQTVGTGGGSIGTMDLTQVIFNAWIDQWIVGTKPNSAGGTTQGIVTLTAGLTDANSILLAQRTEAGTAGIVRGTFNFQGGTLCAGSIGHSPTNLNTASDLYAFNWTGGTLQVDTFGTAAAPFNLLNTGTGILAPGTRLAGDPLGDPTGTTTIYGNYTQGPNAMLDIDIQGNAPGLFDTVTVNGLATLNGIIDASLLDGFTPGPAEYFDILVATSGIVDQGITLSDPAAQHWLMSIVAGSGNTEILRLAYLPEPATLTLLALGALALARRRRRAN